MTNSEWIGGEWRNKIVQLMRRDFGGSEPASESILDSLMDSLQRSGLPSVTDFGKDKGTIDTLYGAMRLCWDSYELWKDRQENGDKALPAEYDDLFVGWIDDLYQYFKVPYIPDGYDGQDNYYELFTYLHIAATRAYRIRSGDEFSEEVIDCLIEVERTMARLDGPYGSSTHFFTEVPSFHTSAGAVSAMAFVELSRVRMSEGRYVEALDYLSGAARYYGGAAANFYGEEIDELWPENAQDEHAWESRLQRLFAGLNVSAVEMVHVLQAIKSHTRFVDDWKQVARDCEAISDSGIHTWDFVELRNRGDDGLVAVPTMDGNSRFDPVEDELIVLNAEVGDDLRDVVTWREFWHGAKVWASAQLSPGEYRNMREEDERYAAERRLRTYFFGGDWSQLPERAQERLINADTILNSTQKVALDSMLNDLRVASEEMCLQIVWKPLDSAKSGSTELLAFMSEKYSLEGKSPGISHYIRICRQNWYYDFLSSREMTEENTRFLTQTLPNNLDQLRSARNLAEHEICHKTLRDTVESYYKGFLGIGQRGTLPELVRILREMKRSQIF